MIFEPLAVEHFRRFRVQPAQRAHVTLLNDVAYQRSLADAGGYAGLVDDGSVLAVAGLIDQGGGRALAWSWLGEGIGSRFVHLHRMACRTIAATRYRRIEMVVDPTNQAAWRWADMLGFTRESRMESWFPDGRAACMFVKIRKETSWQH